jgi:hypothetical protein
VPIGKNKLHTGGVTNGKSFKRCENCIMSKYTGGILSIFTQENEWENNVVLGLSLSYQDLILRV